MNEVQQQLANQSARNLADEAAAQRPEPTAQEIADGQFAYAAYGAPSGAGDTTWDGRPMPTWDQLGDRQRAGYIAIARAFAAGHQIDGVSAVRVRVTGVDGHLVTVESAGKETFAGETFVEGDIDGAATVFLAVRLPDKRTGVLRLPPFAPAAGVEVDAILLS